MKNYVEKVCPVILRQQGTNWQILAFRHPKAGTQLIKGTVEEDERPEAAVLRELAEESGIEQAVIVAQPDLRECSLNNPGISEDSGII